MLYNLPDRLQSVSPINSSFQQNKNIHCYFQVFNKPWTSSVVSTTSMLFSKLNFNIILPCGLSLPHGFFSLDLLHPTNFMQFFLARTSLHHSFNHLDIFGCAVEIMDQPLRLILHFLVSLLLSWAQAFPQHFSNKTFSIQPLSLEEKSKFHGVTVNRKNCRILINGVCRQEEEKITVILAEV
jgi:hypothetical protein